ncbi:MAG: hypothetical protein ACRELC_01045 [Gemmatimonadota bacterium]
MRRIARLPGWPALLVGGLLVRSIGPAAAQEERIPTIPAGVPAVLLPVQAALPTAGGAWLGGVGTDAEVIGLLNAEIAFAVGEEEGAESWALPQDVRERLARNPTIRVDADRLAYHGLIREPERHEQIYEPLHSQLRQIAALFDARVLVLPIRVWYRSPTEEEREAATAAGREAQGRAAMLTAIIDIRRSAVLWHGTIEGAPGEPTSREVLTTLALRAAERLAPS